MFESAIYPSTNLRTLIPSHLHTGLVPSVQLLTQSQQKITVVGADVS
jgi:hypothetical protein